MSIPLTPHEVDKLRALVAERLGLLFDENRVGWLADVFAQRISAAGAGGATAYAARIAQDRRELAALAEQLTVGETYFFRYAEQFRALAEHVLPELLGASSPGRHVRVLSAGCSTGDEAYSLAMLARDRIPADRLGDVELWGVDVNPVAIAKAQRGRYSAWSLRETGDALRSRHFQERGREYDVDPSIRAMVTFQERNLLDDDPAFFAPGVFDLVLFRNVMMYFTSDVMRRTVARIARALRPGGYLFLGHAETLRGISADFHLCHTHETFYYRRKSQAESDASPEVPIEEHVVLRAREGADLTANDVSWVEAIQRASDRIAALSSQGTTTRSPAEDRPQRAAADLLPAVELLRQERFADALAALHALPAHAADDLDAQLLRAVVLTNSGKLAQAEDVCRGILAVDDLNAGAHYLLALGREHAGDLAAAKAEDQVAAYLDPRFAMPHLHLGLLARRAGDEPAARGYLGSALELLGDDDPSRILLFGGGFSREALMALCRAELGRARTT